ncbi:MAG: tryptophan 7-halogenase [Rhodomicrobium sp.]|nr:tryptophan 7-halogenase [Rhodomicrobium sp.]
MPLPTSLADRIEIFRMNGRILSEPDVLFRLVSWISIYDGMGVIPNSYDPLVDCVPEAAAFDVMARIRTGIEQVVGAAPRMRRFSPAAGLDASSYRAGSLAAHSDWSGPPLSAAKAVLGCANYLGILIISITNQENCSVSE